MSEMMLTAKQQKVVVKLSDLQAQTDQLNRLIQTETDPIKQRKMAKKITKLRDRMEHLRVHIILPEQRTRADRLYLRLKTFHILIVLCMIVILFLAAVCIITANQRQEATHLSDHYRNEILRLNHQVEELSETIDVLKEPDAEGKAPPEPENPIPDIPAEQEETVVTPPEESSLYYVRKSADDKSSQLGAFGVFDNAKRLADTNWYDGYKVYDDQGRCVYEPHSQSE